MNLSDLIDRRLTEIPAMPDHTRPLPHTSVGIEVELEGISPRAIDRRKLKRWHLEDEGSILQGVELISEPVWGTAINDTLAEMDSILKGAEPRVTQRCSVHVHVNLLDVDQKAIANLIDLYTVYEQALFSFDPNWDRRNNPFCVPLKATVDLQEHFSQLRSALLSGSVQHDFRRIGSKYAALNFNNLLTLGTAEFRHLGGTVDTRLISSWINILLQMKKAATEGVDIMDEAAVWGEYAELMQQSVGYKKHGQYIINNVYNRRA